MTEPSDNSPFSSREKDVIELLLQAKSNKQIALALGISVSTVEFHLKNIFAKLGVESRVEAVRKLLETTGNFQGDSTVDETGELSNMKDKDSTPDVKQKFSLEDMIKFLVTHKFPAILWFLLLLAIAIILAIILNKPWRTEREAEYPDEYTVGQVIQRSNASDEMVHGQFGTVPAWPPMPGEVTYNIKTPRTNHLYLRLRYSKYSASSVPILVSVDGEERYSLLPVDQGDWNKFVWSEVIDLGKVESGTHAIEFYTEGQTYGVADLDVFILSTEPP
jgi:DNA-binding CsgD family transcriptional regulator